MDTMQVGWQKEQDNKSNKTVLFYEHYPYSSVTKQSAPEDLS